ncbi:MAG: YdeI/OmpD-associated family protein [Bacteroidota bacterium]|nr:YdeI/OmpD-associated family protein [Bacteroidota bacterium]
MGNKIKQVDEYISKSANFAKPILIHLRELVHTGCPKVEETIKWGFPNFSYKGMMCSMASFKNHCSFGFWKAELMKDAETLKANNKNAMGHAGKIKKLSELPTDKVIIGLIKEAVKLNENGIKLPERKKNKEKPEIIVPEALKKELVKYKRASNIFNNFSPSHKREYIEWIDEAKTEETRNKRILTTIEWLTEGKVLNWKYIRK